MLGVEGTLMNSIDVVVLYPPSARRWGEKLVRQLKAQQLSVWDDRTALAPGDDWRAELEQAVDAAPAIVIMVTARQRPDRHQQAAWSVALQADWQDSGKKLVPLLMGDAEVPSFLAGRQALRVREPKTEWDHAVRELIGLLRGDAEKSDTLVVFANEDPAKRATRLGYIEQTARQIKQAS